MGVILPLALGAGTLVGLVIGVVALLLFMRAKCEGRAGSWLRFSLVSIAVTFGLGLLISLWAFLSVKEFADLLLAFVLFGAAPGVGLWVGLVWTRNVGQQNLERSLPLDG